VGGRKEIASNFRMIAATNRNLAAMVEAGQFRSDLFYRIRGLVVELPPLREHPEDIADLVLSHMSKIGKRDGTPLKGISTDFLEALGDYGWPGNVRELIHTLDSALTVSGDEPILFSKHLPPHVRIALVRKSVRGGKIESETAPPPSQTLKERRETALTVVERNYLLELMTATDGDIRNACTVSGLSRPRLYSLLKKYPEVKIRPA